jgi:SET domain-containing protein
MNQGGKSYRVKRSKSGLGLFATKLIPKRKRIIEYTGPRISNDEVEKSSGKYFFGVNKQWSIDGSGRDNIARYINHSCRPNAEAIISRGRIWIWSKKNIKPGEEIVYDYGKEYFEGIIQEIGCKCGKCAGSNRRRNGHNRL